MRLFTLEFANWSSARAANRPLELGCGTGVRYGEGAIATSSDDDPRSSDRPLASNRWSRPMNVVHGQEIVFPPALDTASSNVASSDVVMSSVRTSERPYNTDVIDLTHHMLSARHLLTTTG